MKLDQYYLSYFLTPSSFAIYSVGHFRIPFLNLIFTSIGNLILPKIVNYQKSGQIQKVVILWHKAIKNLALIGFPCMIFSMIMSREIITVLYTESYLESVPVFIIFLFLIPAQITSWGTILRAFGETRFIFKANFIAFLTSIVSGYFLIKLYGVIGGAISAVLVFHIIVWLQVKKGLELLGVSFSKYYPWKDIGKIVVLSIISGILIFFFKIIFPFQSIITLGISFFIYVGSYIFLISIFKLFVLRREELIRRNFKIIKKLFE